MVNDTSRRPSVLVTGATGSLGSELVRAFARRGYHVGIHHRASGERARELLAEARALGGDGLVLAADVTDPEQAAAMVSEFRESSPAIDVLVNNAGGNDDKLLYYMDESTWRQTLALNLDSVFLVTRKVVPAMISERKGSIVNISSLSGLKGLAGQTAYASAKAGLHGFTRALAREVGRFDIRVNVVAPGAIASPSIESLPEAKKTWLEDSACLGRIGRAEEVASVAVFLASDEASFITSQVLRVDGGVI